jgi:hypothetical protein
LKPTGRGRELARLVGQIRALTLELQHLGQHGLEVPEVGGLKDLIAQVLSVGLPDAQARVDTARYVTS